MSGLKPITVNTPTEDEAHIYAEDDAAIYQSLFGEDGVSSVGQACKATVLSNNKVRIADGVICVGGHFARIPYGDYIDCEIENGQSGKNRNDIIVARFETTGTGGIDTYTCEVKKDTAGSTATDPEIVQEDLYKAGKVRELPLYRVKIEGLSITAVEQLFTLRKTNEELEKELESLNSKTMNLEYASVKRRVDAATLAVGKEYTFEQDCYVYFGASFTSTSGYCRVYVTNENDEIVHYVQINPAPTSANAQTTHEYFAKKWWKIKTGSYGSLYNNVISYSLIY